MILIISWLDVPSIYIKIKEKPETLTSMESYLPTSDRHAASWIFSDGPSKQLGVVKLRYNALKLFFFIMSLFYANVPVSASDSHWRQFLRQKASLDHSAWSPLVSGCIGGIRICSWIFSDGPSKQLGVVKLRYNALKLFFFIMALFYANVPVSSERRGVVTARKPSHQRSPLTRVERCHWSERRGVSLRERRTTMQVMLGV